MTRLKHADEDDYFSSFCLLVKQGINK